MIPKHDRVCELVTEIKDHAKNFPNAPRTLKAEYRPAVKLRQ